MLATASSSPVRRPRFRRAATPPRFRLTEDDVDIIRLLARHRFLRSTHIAALVGRSLDHANDRLSRLFHAGYLDRPRAQLDYYPMLGSQPIAYALADRGARLLLDRDGFGFADVDWSRRNREVGRPFIEHQLEIMDFYVALQCEVVRRGDLQLIPPDELVRDFPDQTFAAQNPFALRAQVTHNGVMHEIGVVPDLAFGLRFPDGSRRCFLVEIDRGTMPVVRSDFQQSSFARKMQGYLSASAARQHERRFGWKAFRVVTVTTDAFRLASMTDALGDIRVPMSPGPSLFFFTTRADIGANGVLNGGWIDGNRRPADLA